MGIFGKLSMGNLLGAAQGLTGANKGFKTDMTFTDFGLDADVDLISTDYRQLCKYKVPAQQQRVWGYGDREHAEDAGYLYLRIDSSAGQITGNVRFGYSDANGFDTKVVMEARTNTLSGSTTDRRLMKQLPVSLWPGKNRGANENDYLMIWAMSDSDTTVVHDDADTAAVLPVTIITA
jgi:hypothetical protein